MNRWHKLKHLSSLKKNQTTEKPNIYYYHTDQIGLPREMTDESGKIIWRGQYSAWGKLTEEEKANPSIHQPFRLKPLQNPETIHLFWGVHYFNTNTTK